MNSLLRLTQFAEGENKYRVEVAFEAGGLPRQTATTHFDFKLTIQDQENLRWYLEDFLQRPLDPAPRIAARIEQRMVEIGTTLFKAIFQTSDDARDLWATLRERLDDTRVEIISEVREAAAIPWELIRDPKTDTPLSLRAHSFVRAHTQPAQRPRLPETAKGPIRILLVICRPGGSDDVPFRSVASRLIKGLSAAARELFQLDVLRPATFDQLARVLRAAKDGGEPYHVVHFDGHGLYANVSPDNLSALVSNLSRTLLSGPGAGAHGYLLFESPDAETNVQLVDGPTLGKLLVETHVSVLVLNACRSAHANPQTEPVTAESVEDPHAKIRAFGSFAHEVMDAGVAGVVAMRYNVYVVTAAQFVLELYASLTQGYALGEAVTRGRKQLAAQPMREIAYSPLALQDWPVPIVYEAAPITLFSKAVTKKGVTIKLTDAETTPTRGTIDEKLPPSPDAGFFGRDETLLALDRSFDTQPIVLLHAYAGSGKTSTVAEFARWYSLTGGVAGPVLFTSFERYRPLARVLDQIEQVFLPVLEQAGINWLALLDSQRRQVALHLLSQIPVLWIWDNVEPVDGFPADTPSSWSLSEQQELADFLRAARGTKAKFLLSSRRDERDWLGDLPARVTLPRMPMQERVQLTRALAEKHERSMIAVDDWGPLLEFTDGNPLTISVLVGQALRDGLKTRVQIEGFVQKLRGGEAVFEDEVTEGRSRSLGASLSYGFENAFSESERKQLAFLHPFQSTVNVHAFFYMGRPENDWHIPELRDLTIEGIVSLFDRAAEVGILTSTATDLYRIHPALGWFFSKIFKSYYPAPSFALTASHGFAGALSDLSGYFARLYDDGNHGILTLLMAEEANILHARHLARTNGWWPMVMRSMHGLRRIFAQSNRQSEWKRLVNEIVPEFVDISTEMPLPGREEQFSFMMDYRVRLAKESRRLGEAERLQRICVRWDRERAASALGEESSEEVEDQQTIRTLAESTELLGEILREQLKAECVSVLEETIELYQRIGSRYQEGSAALNLGHAYLGVPSIRNLALAEQWYQHTLKTWQDPHGRGACLGQLGMVAFERFKEAKSVAGSEMTAPAGLISGPEKIKLFLDHQSRLLEHAAAAEEFYEDALSLLPTTASADLGACHNGLGGIHHETYLVFSRFAGFFDTIRSTGFDAVNEEHQWADAGKTHNFERAMHHYLEAVRYAEECGNTFTAAGARYNIALILKAADRLQFALEYAYVSLRDYETFGSDAVSETQRGRALIEEIQQLVENQQLG